MHASKHVFFGDRTQGLLIPVVSHVCALMNKVAY